MKLGEIAVDEIIDLGEKSFSKEEIIQYAEQNDPLDFHTDEKVALKSRFKGLVTSGGQAFNFFYVNRWVPILANSVIAGLGINNWNFNAPIYANTAVFAECVIKETIETTNMHENVIVWHFRFKNKKRELLQELDLKILHKID